MAPIHFANPEDPSFFNNPWSRAIYDSVGLCCFIAVSQHGWFFYLLICWLHLACSPPPQKKNLLSYSYLKLLHCLRWLIGWLESQFGEGTRLETRNTESWLWYKAWMTYSQPLSVSPRKEAIGNHLQNLAQKIAGTSQDCSCQESRLTQRCIYRKIWLNNVVTN